MDPNEQVTSRMTRLETLMQVTREQLTNIDKSITEVGSRLDKSVAALSLQLENLGLVSQRLETFRKEFEDYKKSKSVIAWLFPTISAIVGALLAVLVQTALRK